MSNNHGNPPQLGATFVPGGFDDFYMPEVISPAPQRIMPEVPSQIQDNLAHLELEATGPRRQSVPISPDTPQDIKSGGSYFGGAPNQAPYQQSQQGLHGNAFQAQSYGQQPQPPAPQLYQSNKRQDYGQPGGAQVYNNTQSRFDSLASSRPPTSSGYVSTGQSNEFSQSMQQPIEQKAVHTGPQLDVYKSFGSGKNAYLDHLDQPSFSPFPRVRDAPPNVPPSDEEKEATLEAARVNVLNSNDPEVQLAWAQDALAYVEVSIQNEARVSRNQPARPQTPQVEHQLRVDSLNIVTFLAEQHHPKAEFMRGLWLEFGKFGNRIDKKEAFRCYKRAADRGYSRAEYRIGMSWENSDEFVKAKQHYAQGARQTDSASNYRLGMMTLLGQHGERQDFGRGVQLIRLSAQTADENAPQGAYVFGMLQARELPNIAIPEIFLPLDLSGAKVNLEKAAYLGFAKAQVKMGSAYELCQLGCDFNPALSLHYNALASRQGEAEADMAISKWFLCGYEPVFEKNEELAYSYAQRAAQDKLTTAEFAMGYFNEIGIYVPVNLKEAKMWYEKAAEHGSKDAAARIEGITKDRTLSRQDHEKVAIARIKSHYGSMKNKRPDRSKKDMKPLPAISDSQESPTPTPPPMVKAKTIALPAVPEPSMLPDDNRVLMPDPSQLPAVSGLNPYGNVQVPPRPASAAPYPLEDGPLGRTGPQPPIGGGFVSPHLMPNPVVRPSSAFGINPHLMQAQQAQVGPAPYPSDPNSMTMRPPSRGYQDNGYGAPPRPHSSMDNFRGGRGGRGDPYSSPSRGRGLRPVSDYRAPGGGYNGDRRDYDRNYDRRGDDRRGDDRRGSAGGRGRGDRAPQAGDKPNAPKLDIGFQAPIQPNKLTKADPSAGKPPVADKPQAPYDRRGSTGRPGSPQRSETIPASPKHQNSVPNPLNPQKPKMPLSTQSSPAVPQKPIKTSLPSVPSVPAQPRPPGKGPKTFGEMGVPAENKKDDCATDISANLHNAVSKGSAFPLFSADRTKLPIAKTQTLLKEMQERGEINVSSAGKQSVYHALQEAGDLSNEEDLVGMDGSVANMRDAIHNLKEKHKSLVSTLAHLESTPTTVQLYHSASEKQIQMEGMISRLKTLTDSNVAPVSVQERRMVEESLRIASERLLRRKVIQQELFGAILEATLDCGSADELAVRLIPLATEKVKLTFSQERIGLQFFV
ncbi:MAG: hypothetical protein M1814_006053 [Vezdaea aestivalis]|nr:MAG: hypothetical protein M1814_006053 [Vezdaea aestivalis]